VRALLLPLGVDLYAIPLDRVREVLPLPRVSTLPTAPPSVLGVFNLRGEVVPVLDTSSVLGVVPVAGDASYVAVVDTELGPAALIATDLPRAADLGDSVGPTELPGSAGAYEVDNHRLAVLIELDTLLAPSRLGEGG
jgi:purine-binding chemotaxis protein CheW